MNDGRADGPRVEGFWRMAYRAAEREAARWTWVPTEQQAIVQEVIVRLYLGTCRHTPRALPPQAGGLIRGIARHVALDRSRRSKRAPTSLDTPNAPQLPAADLGPRDAAELAELTGGVRHACALLPPPYKQIAAMRLRGATPVRIAAYLHAWRGVGSDEARRLGRQALEMLRMALAGIDMRTRFPRRFSEKNPWSSTPPPPRFRDKETRGLWRSSEEEQMKITNGLLVMCAVVIGLIAREVLADAQSEGCPGSVLYDANDASQLACTSTCVHNGKSGICVPMATQGTVDVWNYDATAGAWVQTQVGNPARFLSYSGAVEACACHVNEGTEEEPLYVDYLNPCCILFRIPAFDGNTVHMVGVKGTCPSGCPGDQCKATGANNVVAAGCE